MSDRRQSAVRPAVSELLHRDSIFTPPSLANRLVSCLRVRSVNVVADFAAGAGALLDAAQSRWPTSRIFATDIDRAQLRTLRRDRPAWITANCDFLNERSRRRVLGLDAFKGNVDAVLLNPPFSCIGATTISISVSGRGLRGSKAGAFVVLATEYLRKGGELVAIVPSSFLTSEKDHAFRQHLAEIGTLDEIDSSCGADFESVTLHAAMIRFRKGKPAAVPDPIRVTPSASLLSARLNCSIVRGVQQIHSLNNSGVAFRFAHSTELRDEGIIPRVERVRPSTRSVLGPALLLPRVGAVTPQKLAVLARGRVVLSDCVIALQCDSTAVCQELKARLLANWDLFFKAYAGTGARYITISRLKALLGTLGVVAVSAQPDQAPHADQRAFQTGGRYA